MKSLRQKVNLLDQREASEKMTFSSQFMTLLLPLGPSDKYTEFIKLNLITIDILSLTALFD